MHHCIKDNHITLLLFTKHVCNMRAEICTRFKLFMTFLILYELKIVILKIR